MNRVVFKRMFFSTLTALALAGCATERINWTSRIGQYTYNQAVKDYGPPDRFARLSDGTSVAVWMTAPGQTVVSPEGPYWVGPYRRWGPAFPPGYTVTQFPATYLQLTFNKDGALTAEREYSK